MDLLHPLGGLLDHPLLGVGHDDVVHPDGGAEPGGEAKPQLLDRIEHPHRHVGAVVLVAGGDQVAQALLVERFVDELHYLRQLLVEDHPPRGSFEIAVGRAVAGAALAAGAVQAHVDAGIVVHAARFDRHQHLVGAGEVAAFPLGAGLDQRQVVDAQHHVLRRHHDRRPVGRVEQVLGGKHEGPGLDLRLGAQRHVHRHLVAVEVGVEGVADQRMQLDRLALHQHRLERLDAEAVQRRRAVEQYRMLGDHLLQHRPHLGGLFLHQGLGLLDVEHHVLLYQLLHDEGLEQLQGHLGGQPALVQLEIRTHHDHRTPGVVDPLAQQILPEAALLALEHVGQRLQRTVGGPLHHALLLGIVEQGVHRFLQHPLFVADDDVRRTERQQPLEAIVAIDHPAVEIVQVGGGETPAVELHHGPQLRRNDRNYVKDHPLRLVARVAEVFHDLDPLQQPLVAPGALVDHPGAQFDTQGVELQALQQGANRFRADIRGKGHSEPIAGLHVLFLGEQVHAFQVGVAGIDDDVLLVVQNRTQRRNRQIEQQPHARRHRAVEPDVRHRGRQLDVAHAFPPHPEVGDLHPAAVADHAAVADRLELAAVALPLLGGAEDALAEQAVLLRPQGAVVDRLGLLDLAVGPGPNLLRRGQLDGNLLEVVKVSHAAFL